MRGEQVVSEAALERRRAFVLLDRAYDELRRALTWLRWHEDDVDTLAPSLHAQPRSGRKSKAEEAAEAAAIAAKGANGTAAVVKPIVAAPMLPPIEGTTDRPVPVSKPFIT